MCNEDNKASQSIETHAVIIAQHSSISTKPYNPAGMEYVSTFIITPIHS